MQKTFQKPFRVFVFLVATLSLFYSCKGERKTNSEKHVDNKITRQDTIQSETNKMGNWEIVNYVDDFNEDTDKQFIALGPIDGVLSNSSSTNSTLKVRIEVDSAHVEIKLFEYGSKYQADLGGKVTFKVKDSNGGVYDIDTYKGCTYKRQRDLNDSLFRVVLSKGGEIKFSAKHTQYGNTSSYNFTVPNADHFEDAMNELTGNSL